jgi:flagellar basal body-associated protein FliL
MKRKLISIILIVVIYFLGVFAYFGAISYFGFKDVPNGSFSSIEKIMAFLIPLFVLLYPTYLIISKK